MTRQPWPANGGIYRAVDSWDVPWVPTPPLTFDNPKFDGFPWDASLIHKESSEEKRIRRRRERAAQRLIDAERRKKKCSRFWRSFKDLFDDEENGKGGWKLNPTLPFVPPWQWKAYGYWARPVINGVQVHNATPRGPIPPITIDPDVLWDNLRGPNGTPRPETWPARFQHPALPPRPPEWPTPPQNARLPFPWETQLNPYLEHRYIGRTLISFDIGRPPLGIVFTESEPAAITLDQSDFCQPATFPFATHMHVVGVADDPAPIFPWPIMVRNERGITCGDVFQAISSNFQEHVTVEEYNGWSGRRRDLAARAYQKRVHEPLDWTRPHEIPGRNDGLRRIDYMGDKVMFRGLEPSPWRDGTWIMFVGPP
ncbi:hypothetical protein F5I97DRAFT_1807635 [Phlebopus sp. FC_14]|nr:hypothetical protein F5I97DRAFT_1807635 [Phlebopus sp. FC_14]